MKLVQAEHRHLEVLAAMVRAYHDFESIVLSHEQRRRALEPLLSARSDAGRIWLIESNEAFVGYVAVCFGYSIEFGGRDAFVDEFFVKEDARGHGLGTAALNAVKDLVVSMDLVALHLEVERDNHRAKALYTQVGFKSRERFMLMSRKLGD